MKTINLIENLNTVTSKTDYKNRIQKIRAELAIEKAQFEESEDFTNHMDHTDHCDQVRVGKSTNRNNQLLK